MGIHSRSSSCEWIAARCHITSLTTENEKDRLRSTACLMCCGLEVGNQHLMSVSDSKADVYMCLYNSPLGVFYLLYRLLYTVSKRRCSSTKILQESLGLESCFFFLSYLFIWCCASDGDDVSSTSASSRQPYWICSHWMRPLFASLFDFFVSPFSSTSARSVAISVLINRVRFR